MAFNIQAFKTRALTAVVFVVIMLLGLFWDRWSLVILFTIINFGCWWEYFKLVEKINSTRIDPFFKYFFLFVSAVMLYCAAFPYYSFDFFLMIAGREISFKYLFLAVVFLLLVIFSLQNKRVSGKAWWMCFTGFLYITLPCILMIDLRTYFSLKHADVSLQVLPAGIIFSIWINDTMAYIVGSLIGKTPFSKISAKKTWEGTIGGAVLCIVVIALVGWLTNFYSVQDWIAISAICAVFGTLGDLLESKLKRLAGVKDSGTLMPGHGGFLDRFDSLIIATPFVWLYVYFFIR